MPLTLEQYATYLDTRGLPWPVPPAVKRPKARPHLVALPDVRVVIWNVYGTLLNISGGELLFEHPQQFVMDVALDKTVQEFKMWGSMTRKPGQPAEYLGTLYRRALDEQRMDLAQEGKYPELAAERVWEDIIKKLFQKEYQFDAGFYGSLNEFSRKVAYFFHASLQGTACYAGAAAALKYVKDRGLRQGLLADGQCFTPVQLQRGLVEQDAAAGVDQLFGGELRVLSYQQRGCKPSDRLFRQMLELLQPYGLAAGQVLHIGSRVEEDIAPARRFGMRTGLFAGDKGSLAASAEQLKDAASRPDVLLTELEQIKDIIP
jgi:FMN phosphatase YigB (HAD superfamily)